MDKRAKSSLLIDLLFLAYRGFVLDNVLSL